MRLMGWDELVGQAWVVYRVPQWHFYMHFTEWAFPQKESEVNTRRRDTRCPLQLQMQWSERNVCTAFCNVGHEVYVCKAASQFIHHPLQDTVADALSM